LNSNKSLLFGSEQLCLASVFDHGVLREIELLLWLICYNGITLSFELMTSFSVYFKCFQIFVNLFYLSKT